MKIDLKKFDQSVAEKLGDIPNMVFVTQEVFGIDVLRNFHVGIFSFNDCCFFTNGEKIDNSKVVLYGHCDIDELYK